MKYEMNKVNKICLFHDLNQWDEEITKILCWLYWPSINVKYNLWIDLNEDDIKIIFRQMEIDWKIIDWVWMLGADWVEYIYQYIKDNHKERGWNIPNLCIMTEDSDVKAWTNKWYSVLIWIKYNDEFIKDIRDFKIDKFEDYKNYKWDNWHFTNLIKYNCRGWECSDKWREFILDSYFRTGGSWYECSIKEMLEDLDMKTKYVFF